MILRELSRALLCACVIAGCVLSGSALHAQDADETLAQGAATERARMHFRHGVDFYREGNFRAAQIEFKRAYKAAPHYKLFYNLGQVSLELQEDGAAIDYFANYLREGADELTPERKREVQEAVVRLQARLAHAVITTDQSGAEIYVDDSLVGTAPLSSAVRLSVGRRRIKAQKRGFVTSERLIEVAAGDHLVVALELRENNPSVGKLSAGTVTHTESALAPSAWVGIATGVVGVGAVTLTVLTGLAQSSFNSERNRQTSERKLQDLRDDAKLKALAADIAWGVTAVGAGVTAVLLWTGAGSERSPAERDQRPKGVKVEVGAGSLQLRGQF